MEIEREKDVSQIARSAMKKIKKKKKFNLNNSSPSLAEDMAQLAGSHFTSKQ